MSWFTNLFLPRPKIAPGSGIPRVDLMRCSAPMSDELQKLGYTVTAEFVGNTNSNLPFMDANSVLLLEHCRFEDLQSGQIVTYQASDGSKKVHPLQDRRPGGWTAKGYNNAEVDPELVNAGNFIARVCAVLIGKKSTSDDK